MTVFLTKFSNLKFVFPKPSLGINLGIPLLNDICLQYLNNCIIPFTNLFKTKTYKF